MFYTMALIGKIFPSSKIRLCMLLGMEKEETHRAVSAVQLIKFYKLLGCVPVCINFMREW